MKIQEIKLVGNGKERTIDFKETPVLYRVRMVLKYVMDMLSAEEEKE